MISVLDRQKIERRARLANIASVGGLLTLLASVLLPLLRVDTVFLVMPLMVSGLLAAMIGIYFANRWVKRPRPEDSLDKALKSLNDSYRLYHYLPLPCDHVLLSPNGLVVLETVNLDGSFTYKDGRWKEKMTLGRALRYVVEEHLGDPVRSALGCEQELQRLLIEKIPSGGEIPVRSIVVFAHPIAQVEVKGEPSAPVIRLDKLKKYLPVKTGKMPPGLYELIRDYLDGLK